MEFERKFTKLARHVFLAAIPLIALLILAGVAIFWGLGIAVIGDNFIVLADQAPIPERRLYGLVAVSVPTIIMLFALWRLFQMFRGRPDGLMGPETVGHLRAFSVLSIGMVITAFLLSGVMRWAMGVFDTSPLWTHLGFSLAHAAILFGASIVYVATFLIEEGYAYKREMDEYI